MCELGWCACLYVYDILVAIRRMENTGPGSGSGGLLFSPTLLLRERSAAAVMESPATNIFWCTLRAATTPRTLQRNQLMLMFYITSPTVHPSKPGCRKSVSWTRKTNNKTAKQSISLVPLGHDKERKNEKTATTQLQIVIATRMVEEHIWRMQSSSLQIDHTDRRRFVPPYERSLWRHIKERRINLLNIVD